LCGRHRLCLQRAGPALPDLAKQYRRARLDALGRLVRGPSHPSGWETHGHGGGGRRDANADRRARSLPATMDNCAAALRQPVVSVWLVREPRVWLLACMTGLFLILAMGDEAYLYSWLRRLFPPLNFINFPIKFVVPVTFCGPLLAAFAVREWQSASVENKSRV